MLEAFEALPPDDKRAFAFEVLHRSRDLGVLEAQSGNDAEWEHNLRMLLRQFQNESEPAKAQQQWKQIEKEVFGVEFDD